VCVAGRKDQEVLGERTKEEDDHVILDLSGCIACYGAKRPSLCVA
jgi:hypothetical protein